MEFVKTFAVSFGLVLGAEQEVVSPSPVPSSDVNSPSASPLFDPISSDPDSVSIETETSAPPTFSRFLGADARALLEKDLPDSFPPAESKDRGSLFSVKGGGCWHPSSGGFQVRIC